MTQDRPILPYSVAHAVYVEYNPAVVDVARRVGELIEQAAPWAVVEHIGSTAIPGMAAKDVLDLQITVTSLEDAAREFDEPLGSLGFHRTPYERDHVPAGWPDDGREWVKRLWARREHPGGDVNLHVRLAGSPNERLALLFRDWFRAHPEAVPAYAAFKRSLAAAVPDIATYSNVKDPVVDLVITMAGTWATATGWQP